MIVMTWSVATAKARLSELLKRARRGPQVIESRGEPVAVVLSTAEFERLKQAAEAPKETPMAALMALTERLRGDEGLDLELPLRGADRDRAVPSLGD